MSILNFLFPNTITKQKEENTLNLVTKKSEDKVSQFQKLVQPTTDKRTKLFNTLFSFALDGEQWTNQETDDLDEEKPLTFNFSENYVDRYMARLFPRNPHTGVMEIGIKVYEKNNNKQQKLEQIIIDFYKREKFVDLLLEQGINYLAGGAGIFYYPQDPITKKAQLISLDPKDCFLGWKGKNLVQFAYREYIGDNKYNIYYWDLAEFIFIDGKTKKAEQTKNEFNFIPVSWIPNNSKPHKHEGRSKIESIYNLDKEYNKRATDFGIRIGDNTRPPLVVKSTSVGLDDIDRGKKKKTKIGPEDSMEYLELKEGQEIENYLNLLEAKIKGKAGIVDSSGSIKSNLSGVSIAFQYSDMMDLIGFMRISWDGAIRDMNHAVLTYEQGVSEYKTDPIYHPFINIDNKQRIEEYVLMIENNLISRYDAIDQLRSVENPADALDDILKENKKFKPEPQLKSEKPGIKQND